MSSIPGVFPNASVLASQQPVARVLSQQEIMNEISAITAQQILLIANQIAQPIPHRLGPINKLRIEQQIQSQRDQSNNPVQNMMRRMLMLQAKADPAQNRPIFSEEKHLQFLFNAWEPVGKKITECFSLPSSFLEDGMYFQLSDFQPHGLLKQMSEKLKLNLTLFDVPHNYYIYLKIDEQLTQKNSDLTFVLIEKSDDVEFARKSFTIKELEAAEREAMASS